MKAPRGGTKGGDRAGGECCEERLRELVLPSVEVSQSVIFAGSLQLNYSILSYQQMESAKLFRYQTFSKRLKNCLDSNATSYMQDSLLPQTKRKKKR